jgi:RNA polymerase sigma factor (sigma-70 family)
MAVLDAAARALLNTPDADVRMWWAEKAWHRITPVLQAWAWMAVPMSYGFDSDDREDLISRAVIRAWTSPYVPDRPRAWIVTVVNNLSRDTQKAAYRNDTRDTEAADQLLASQEADDWVEEEAYRERLGRLREALRRLPDEHRRCLVLHDLHGRTTADIAAQFGLTDGAVKMRLVRARRLLAAIYHGTPSVGLTAEGVPRKKRGRRPKTVTWREVAPREQGIVERAKLDLAGLT